MLSLRLRLAPAWLRAQPRRRPMHAAVTVVILPALLTVLMAATLLPHPSPMCRWNPAVTPGKPHLVCQQVNRPTGKP
jgi:hypothetical protein